jgi:hypothetical protein
MVFQKTLLVLASVRQLNELLMHQDHRIQKATAFDVLIVVLMHHDSQF